MTTSCFSTKELRERLPTLQLSLSWQPLWIQISQWHKVRREQSCKCKGSLSSLSSQQSPNQTSLFTEVALPEAVIGKSLFCASQIYCKVRGAVAEQRSLGRAAYPGGMCFYLCFNQTAVEETLQAQLHLLEGCLRALTPAGCHVNSQGAEQ